MRTTIGFNEYLVKNEDIETMALAEQAGREVAKLIQKGEDPDYISILKKWVPEYKTHDEVLKEGFELYKSTYVYESTNEDLYGKYLLFLVENGCYLETLTFSKETLYEDEFTNPAMAAANGADPEAAAAPKQTPQQQYDALFGQFSTAANAHLAKDRSVMGYVKRAGAFIGKTFKGLFNGIAKAFGSIKGLVTNLYKRLSKPFGTVGAGLILTIAAVLIITGPIWMPSVGGIALGTIVYGAVFGFIGKKIGENVGNEIVKAHGGSKFAQNVGGFIGKITGAAIGAGGGKLLAGVVHDQGLLLVGKICTLSPKIDSIFGKLLPIDKTGHLLPPSSGADQVAKQVQAAAKTVKPEVLDQGIEAAHKSATKVGGVAKKGLENLEVGKAPPMDAGGGGVQLHTPDSTMAHGEIDVSSHAGTSTEVVQNAAANAPPPPMSVPDAVQGSIQKALKAGHISGTSPTQINALMSQPLNPARLRELSALVYDPTHPQAYNALMKAAGPKMLKAAGLYAS
jgi:hypothetical protein